MNYCMILYIVIGISVPVGHQKVNVSLFQTNSHFLLEDHCN